MRVLTCLSHPFRGPADDDETARRIAAGNRVPGPPAWSVTLARLRFHSAMSFAAARRASRAAFAGERGQTAPLMMLMMALLVVGGVMVIDVGLAFNERRAAQAAVDFAALAAAQELPSDPLDPQLSTKLAAAEDTAADYLRRNGYDPDDVEVQATIVAPYDGDVQSISIEVHRPYHWLIGRVFRLDDANIGARAVAHADSQPRDIVLVLDRSGSMCEATHGGGGNCPDPPGDPDGNGVDDWQPFDQMRDAALGFTDNFTPFIGGTPYDQMALVSYSSSATLDQALTTDYGVASAYEAAIDAMRPDGTTNIAHALYVARTELEASTRPAQPVIVLLSDGRANDYLNGGSWASPTFAHCSGGCASADNDAVEQATLAAQAGASIYTIGLTEDAGTALLQQIADIGLSQGSGGQFFSVEDPDDLDAVFTEIASLVGFALAE